MTVEGYTNRSSKKGREAGSEEAVMLGTRVLVENLDVSIFAHILSSRSCHLGAFCKRIGGNRLCTHKAADANRTDKHANVDDSPL
jgi:hypothetical protein